MDAKQLKMFQIAGAVFIVAAIVIFFASGWAAALPMALGGVALIVIASSTPTNTPEDTTDAA